MNGAASVRDAIRDSIESIVITSEEDGLGDMYRGRFAGLIEQYYESEEAASEETASTSVVAGARFELTTFRL